MFHKILPNITIRFGLSTAFAGIVALTAILTGYSTYTISRQIMRKDLEKRIVGIAAIGVQRLDADAHHSLMSAGQETTDVYRTLKKILQEIRDCDTDVRFVYTMRKTSDGLLVFVVDAEEDASKMSHIGDKYTEATPVMQGMFAHPVGPVCEPSFSTDEWGTWLSAYAPIWRGDTLEAILGVDISAEQIVKYERLHLLLIAIASLFTMAVVMLIGLVISRGITKPMNLLGNDMAKIRELKFDEQEKLPTRFIEIENMQKSLENMKRGLRSFRKFVPADLVSQIITRDDEARFGGEKRLLTVCFSDIADFTAISEKMLPEDLASLLAIYFEGMSKCIFNNRGTIDKFIGDAIMSFWGAPSANENHALDACRAALHCQEFLAKLKVEWSERGFPIFNTRIGINTGHLIVGNFGYEERLNYTVIGDNVNIASRMEGINKIYGTSILISESTWQATRDHVNARCVDIVAVQGKQIGLPVFELLGLKEFGSRELDEQLRVWELAFETYLHREWGKAQELFDSFTQQNPADRPARLLADRCAGYAQNPPPHDWTGVIFLSEK